jgi:IrrE N-terminal-like domain
MSQFDSAVIVARRLLDEYEISSPSEIDIEAIALDRGVFVTEGPLVGSWARLVRKGNGGLIRVSNDVKILGQRRFCIAHELGHFLLHPGVSQLEFCTSKDMVLAYAGRPEEPEANAFAGELLMPDPLIRPRLNPRELTLRELQAIAEEFETTISACIQRVVDTNVYVCALVRSEAGVIKSFHRSYDFPFRIRENRSRLDARTCAGEFFINGSATEREAEVPADAWLDDVRFSGSETVRELTIPMPNFRSALSVLWIVPRSRLDQLAAEDDE